MDVVTIVSCVCGHYLIRVIMSLFLPNIMPANNGVSTGRASPPLPSSPNTAHHSNANVNSHQQTQQTINTNEQTAHNQTQQNSTSTQHTHTHTHSSTLTLPLPSHSHRLPHTTSGASSDHELGSASAHSDGALTTTPPTSGYTNTASRGPSPLPLAHPVSDSDSDFHPHGSMVVINHNYNQGGNGTNSTSSNNGPNKYSNNLNSSNKTNNTSNNSGPIIHPTSGDKKVTDNNTSNFQDSGPVYMEGKLTKRSKKILVGLWRTTRYFRLTETALTYTDKDLKTLKGIHFVESMVDVNRFPSRRFRDRCFTLRFEDNTLFHLRAPTNEECERWIDAFTKVIQIQERKRNKDRREWKTRRDQKLAGAPNELQVASPTNGNVVGPNVTTTLTPDPRLQALYPVNGPVPLHAVPLTAVPVPVSLPVYANGVPAGTVATANGLGIPLAPTRHISEDSTEAEDEVDEGDITGDELDWASQQRYSSIRQRTMYKRQLQQQQLQFQQQQQFQNAATTQYFVSSTPHGYAYQAYHPSVFNFGTNPSIPDSTPHAWTVPAVGGLIEEEQHLLNRSRVQLLWYFFSLALVSTLILLLGQTGSTWVSIKQAILAPALSTAAHAINNTNSTTGKTTASSANSLLSSTLASITQYFSVFASVQTISPPVIFLVLSIVMTLLSHRSLKKYKKKCKARQIEVSAQAKSKSGSEDEATFWKEEQKMLQKEEKQKSNLQLRLAAFGLMDLALAYYCWKY